MSRFRSHALIALLLPALLAGVGRAQAQSDKPPDFETFVLPNPTPPAPQSSANATLTPSQISNYNPQKQLVPQDNLAARIGLTLFPGNSDLGIFLSGHIAGQNLQSQMSPLHWLTGDYTGSGYFDISHNGEGMNVGNDTEDALGNMEGLRLYGLGKLANGTLSASLYQDITETNPFRGTPAIEDDWRFGKGNDTDFLAAADSSWRLSELVTRKLWQFSAFAGRDDKTDRPEAGTYLSAQIGSQSSIYNNLVAWGGHQAGITWSAGATHRFGPLFVGIDNSLSNENTDLVHEFGAGAILPIRNGSLAMRLQHGVIDPQDGFGVGTQNSSLAFISANKIVNSSLILSTTAGESVQSSMPTQRFIAVGATKQLNSQWNLYADITQRLDINRQQFQLAVGCRIDQYWQVRILCAPSALPTTDAVPPEVFGVQITRSLSIKRTRSGSIAGAISLDGGKYTKPLQILLDGAKAAKSGSDGRFKIGRVVPGTHTVQIDPASLPADLCPDHFEVDVVVDAGKTSDANFAIHKVSSITGHVDVLPDALGQVDPTAGIGVTISAGGNFATTTDGNGDFILGDIPAGTYSVAINKGTIPPDFEVVGPDHMSIVVTPDQPTPPVSFSIRSTHMKVQFSENAIPAKAPAAVPSAMPKPAGHPVVSQPKHSHVAIPARVTPRAAAGHAIKPAAARSTVRARVAGRSIAGKPAPATTRAMLGGKKKAAPAQTKPCIKPGMKNEGTMNCPADCVCGCRQMPHDSHRVHRMRRVGHRSSRRRASSRSDHSRIRRASLRSDHPRIRRTGLRAHRPRVHTVGRRLICRRIRRANVRTIRVRRRQSGGHHATRRRATRRKTLFICRCPHA